MSWVNNLKRIMKDKDVNIENLKNRIVDSGHSLSRNSIGNILNERNSPKLDTIQVIAEALEVELNELFSERTLKEEPVSNELDGFIDFEGSIYRIKSREELKNVYDKIIGFPPELQETKDLERKSNFRRSNTGGSLLARAKARQHTNKLQVHMVQRFNVTVSNKREMEYSNNLPRDTRIWVFKSNQEEIKARQNLQRTLRFNFNT